VGDPFSLNSLSSDLGLYGLFGLLVGLALTPFYVLYVMPKSKAHSGLGLALVTAAVFGASGLLLGAVLGFEHGVTKALDSLVSVTQGTLTGILDKLGLDPNHMPIGKVLKIWNRLPIPQALWTNQDLPSLRNDFTSVHSLLSDLRNYALARTSAFVPFLLTTFALLPVVYGFLVHFLVQSENKEEMRRQKAAKNGEIAL